MSFPRGGSLQNVLFRNLWYCSETFGNPRDALLGRPSIPRANNHPQRTPSLACVWLLPPKRGDSLEGASQLAPRCAWDAVLLNFSFAWQPPAVLC